MRDNQNELDLDRIMKSYSNSAEKTKIPFGTIVAMKAWLNKGFDKLRANFKR